jgi:hypothetical protein
MLATSLGVLDMAESGSLTQVSGFGQTQPGFRERHAFGSLRSVGRTARLAERLRNGDLGCRIVAIDTTAVEL